MISYINFIFLYLLSTVSIIENAFSMMEAPEEELLVRRAPKPSSHIIKTSPLSPTHKLKEVCYDPIRDMLYRGASLPIDDKYLFELEEHIYNKYISYTAAKNVILLAPQVQGEKQIIDIRRHNHENNVRETILKRVSPDTDGRVHVSNSLEWPYTIHAQITTQWEKKKKYLGSGVMIGPHHILTAGHIVYQNKMKWANRIEVYPALNNRIAPFGKIDVAAAYAFDGWIKYGRPEYDMAILVLSQSIGTLTGWAGISCLEDEIIKNLKIEITGYPGNKGGQQLWTMVDSVTKVNAETINYHIDTSSGQSGSAIWFQDDETPLIIGVHTRGEEKENSGVRITDKKLSKIEEVIFRTYELNSDIKSDELNSDIKSENGNNNLKLSSELSNITYEYDPTLNLYCRVVQNTLCKVQLPYLLNKNTYVYRLEVDDIGVPPFFLNDSSYDFVKDMISSENKNFVGEDTQRFPWHSIGSLVIQDDRRISFASAVLIEESFVLTAAHNLIDPDKQIASKVTFYPAMYGAHIPICVQGESVIIAKDFYSKYEDPKIRQQSNLSLIKLATPIKIVKPFDIVIGWEKTAEEKMKKVNITGYPGEPPFCGRFMLTQEGEINDLSSGVIRYNYYDEKKYRGKSGSAVWISTKEGPKLIGIHTYEREEGRGAFLTQKNVSRIMKWIKALKEED